MDDGGRPSGDGLQDQWFTETRPAQNLNVAHGAESMWRAAGDASATLRWSSRAPRGRVDRREFNAGRTAITDGRRPNSTLSCYAARA